MRMPSKRWMTRGALGLAVLVAASFAVGSLGGTSQQHLSKGVGGGEDMAWAPEPDMMTTDAVEGVALQSRSVMAAPQGRVAPSSEDRSASLVDGAFGDRIIRTTTLSVEVEKGNFDRAWEGAMLIAQELGGQVINSSRGDLDEDRIVLEERSRDTAFGTISMRVPTNVLEEATSRLRTSLGDLRRESTSSQDVTQEYIDLKSRVRNLRAEREVLLDLFARAKSVRDTLSVQRRLSDVQGEIEQIIGRINFIESRTEFSLITLQLAEPGATIFRPDDSGPSFAQAWETAIDGLVRIATTAMIAGIWLLPFAVLALVLLSIRRKIGPATPAA